MVTIYSHVIDSFRILKCLGTTFLDYVKVSVLHDARRYEDVRGSRSIVPRIFNLGMVKDGSEWSRSRPGRFHVGKTTLVHTD
jgi:hypothetical protein